MAYSLSFTPEFFWGRIPLEEVGLSDRPTSVLQALVSLPEGTRIRMARDLFGANDLDPMAVMERIRQTDTCAHLDSPVEVFIDVEGTFSLFVFEEKP